MSQRITVGNLMNEVRQQLDDENQSSINDAEDILPALNRAQNYACDTLARHYKEPLLTSATIITSSSDDFYDIPEDAFENRLLKVEVDQNGVFFDVAYVSYQDFAVYEITSNAVAIPFYYTIVGQRIKLLPKSSGTYNLRIWYLRDPAPLAKEQGRINILNAASNYIIVDDVGDDLSVESDQLASFVSLIDGNSGIAKGTFQIQAINGNKITFKTVPTRTTVLDIPVDTDLTLLDPAVTVDDYICLVPNSCVPFLKKPLSNFLIQYAVAELTRKLGGDAPLEEEILKKFDQQVERTWVQRPNDIRVRKRNANWNNPTR